MESILNNSKQTIEIKKSKFIGYSFFCENIQDLDTCLNELSGEHKKATHICYAYVIDNFEKAVDSGEPSGTAGWPILEVIKKQKLKNCLCVVVRYFGGIKLGAGGLSRAYSRCAANVLKSSGRAQLKQLYTCKIELDYGEEFMLNKLKKLENIYNLNVEYAKNIIVHFSVDKPFANSLFEDKVVQEINLKWERV